MIASQPTTRFAIGAVAFFASLALVEPSRAHDTGRSTQVRRGRVDPGYSTGDAVVQYFEYACADVLQRDGRDRVATRCGHYLGVQPS